MKYFLYMSNNRKKRHEKKTIELLDLKRELNLLIFNREKVSISKALTRDQKVLKCSIICS